ncbi:recombinase zinc beta ribbon domain-containing protein [Sphingorhabdus sp.]|uniref:zinc ribbon domain-containing protein n=1 Tax=Sphingorhabdus sp. TaxID=1902408 RepID=UPI0037CBF240
MPLFEAVQAKLTRNNPKVIAPRVVNGPILLTGLAVCATCGSGMTRTGTKRGNRSYSYYTCAGCHQKGPSVCKGRHIPLAKLDDLILSNVKEQLLAPERLEDILCKLVERRTSRQTEVAERRCALEAQRDKAKDKLARLYRAIEDGVVELDADLKDRIQAIKQERDLAETAIERIIDTAASRTEITPERLTAFSALMRDKLETGDIHARKAYLRAVMSRIEVDDENIRIIGEKTSLEKAVGTTLTGKIPVSGLVRKWCRL